MEESYHLRDIETKEILHKFRTSGGALEYKGGMRYGLKHYYELYDSKNKSVIEESLQYSRYQRKRVKDKKNKKRMLVENMAKI